MSESASKSAVGAGLLLVLAYCLINSTKSVFEAALVQHLSPEFIAFHSFLLAGIFFFAVCRNKRALFAAVRSSWTDVLAFNITTTVSWLAVLYAFTVFEPVVANSVILGLIPSITILLGLVMRPGTKVLGLEVTSAIGVLFAISLLVVVTWSGSSATGGITPGGFALGLTACALTSAAVAGNTFYTKRLNEAGMSVPQMMASRFVLIVILALGLLLARESFAPYTPNTVGAVVLIGVVGVIISLYLLQQGIVRTEPITVSLLFGVNVVITYVIQFFDPRLDQSAFSFAGVVLLSLSMCLGAWGRWRHERAKERSREPRSPGPAPRAAG